MTDKLPYMPFYGFDYETDERVKLLTDAEHGVYFRLLWQQWKEGSVPADPERCARVLGHADPTICAQILAAFFEPFGEGRKRNQTLFIIRRVMEAEWDAKSKGGKWGRAKQLREKALRAQPELSLGSPRGEAGLTSGIPEPEPKPEPKKISLEPEAPGAKTLVGFAAQKPTSNGKTRKSVSPRNKETIALQDITSRIGAAILEITTMSDDKQRKEKELELQAEFGFAYWALKTGHKRSIYDPEFHGRILRRVLVKNKGNLSEVLYVVDGLLKDDYRMGREPGKPKVYDSIESIFRNRDVIERLANNVADYQAGHLHPMIVRHFGGFDEPRPASTH